MDKKIEFVTLAAEIEAEQAKLQEKKDRLTALMTELGVDTYAQDLNTLAVYKIIKPLGTFTYYKDIDYKRTALEGERGGTVLAKKEAEEAGFNLKK